MANIRCRSGTTREKSVPYLNCPSCEISLYRAAGRAGFRDCPRCRSNLNRQVPMFLTEGR